MRLIQDQATRDAANHTGQGDDESHDAGIDSVSRELEFDHLIQDRTDGIEDTDVQSISHQQEVEVAIHQQGADDGGEGGIDATHLLIREGRSQRRWFTWPILEQEDDGNKDHRRQEGDGEEHDVQSSLHQDVITLRDPGEDERRDDESQSYADLITENAE